MICILCYRSILLGKGKNIYSWIYFTMSTFLNMINVRLFSSTDARRQAHRRVNIGNTILNILPVSDFGVGCSCRRYTKSTVLHFSQEITPRARGLIHHSPENTNKTILNIFTKGWYTNIWLASQFWLFIHELISYKSC